MSVAEYDAIIVGGGHNGLTCGAYLARAGKKVLVLERRHLIGGAAVTEEFTPGFRASTFSYVMSLLHPKVIRDLELRDLGLTRWRDLSAIRRVAQRSRRYRAQAVAGHARRPDAPRP